MPTTLFRKVLVANRGEIAVRVQQTLRAMGMSTVAVYSDPDAPAPHVAISNEAYPLRGSTAEETYLDIEKLIEIARTSGADAIHPGYGFLSENAAFARACQDAGIVFIGPTPESIELLGDKVRSKELAQKAGVPVTPSSPVSNGNSTDLEAFLAQSEFPLLVKAAAGGGGRGMRVVEERGALAQSLEAASREARAAFGDGRVFLEKFISRPRHVEFQVLSDSHGNTIHLLERECSVQRRHQKIIEETPSPAVTRELRQRMGEAAVVIAKAAGYVNAGTVEFLLDGDGNFYFLEMNTRLQVEHPITEAVTGLDLVEWQVRIAAGEPLALRQEEIAHNGHAIECRIYAENPYSGFLPSTGRLLHWQPPSGPGLRLDSGVTMGQEVSTYYDPMLAKLVAWGSDRRQSLSRMEEALRQFAALGVVTNIPFLREVISHPKFQEGECTTRFLEENPDLMAPDVSDDARMLANALAAIHSGQSNRVARDSESDSSDSNSPWRLAGPWRLS